MAEAGYRPPELTLGRACHIYLTKPADRLVEVLVEVPSTEPFDPHELESAQLLQLVRTRLWEDTRISQAERVQLITLCSAIMQRLGSVAGRA